MSQISRKGNVPVQPEDVGALFGSLFSREVILDLLRLVAPNQKLYWRVLTPLIMLWGFVYQRLHTSHSCDAYLSHLHSGGADGLDQADPHEQPLSERLVSESTASYAEGRRRLPLEVLQEASYLVASHAASLGGQQGEWHGLPLRLLDGSTFLLPPKGDLAATYGRAQTKSGPSDWVKARTVMAFDWFSQAVTAATEGPYAVGESSLVLPVVAQERQPGCLYVGDRNFGIYRVAQALVGHGHHVLLRMAASRAKALLRRQPAASRLDNGEWQEVEWAPSGHDQPFPDLPAPTIGGRLLYLRVEVEGQRPYDLYLFTSLGDEEAFPMAELAELYGQRWEVEIRFRHIKTTLEMDFFDVRTAEMFRKELAAGLLTYNLICVLMTQAALRAGLHPNRLSFQRCARRIHGFLTTGVPAWVQQEGQVADHLLDRLARCKLPNQPDKVQHEPRLIRYKPRPYGTLRGDRDAARAKYAAESRRPHKS